MAELTMMRRSPLAALARDLMDNAVTGERNVRVSEWRFTTMVSLRVDPTSAAADALEGVLGTTLPRSSGEVTSHGQHSVLWLGPDEWLVVSQMSADALVPALQECVAGAHAAVVDVSANRTVLELRGASALAVLQKGCPLDLHPRAFGPGQAVSTTLARIPLVLWQVGPDSYRLLPRASFAEYVARWLLDASLEFASTFRDGGRSE
ncbi:sarcosine oxidase subunit gamma family protein [Nocardioides immobilis]|uniref:Sarcosine oxidase subunit gamma family protein n=1 Tax=Nocardioides immobilis TaxID=2049295 RepID=A0A417XZR7_9ACTN|nr:sarcosine oxidase subunit gamma family protein [Nocardioides immobilis]RHW25869.1 sarcosine oxidase subunit gamma family protein [Nocardioides immobilis]